MFKLPGKILCSVLIFFILSLSLLVRPSFLFAEASVQDIFNPSVQNMVWEKKQAKEKAKGGELQIYSGAVAGRQFDDVSFSIADRLIGVSCSVDKDLCDQPTAINSITNFMALMYQNPAASSVFYAYDLFKNAGFVSPAYAQGIGFSGLSPLLLMWKTTRNIAYAAIIIILVAIGFMIIFRMKIDPKTVIGIQAAIPKIILTLVLITFSYPIVGFLVDLMYLVMAFVISIVAQGINQSSRASEFQSYFMTAGGMQLLGTVFSGGFSSWDDFIFKNIGSYAVGGAGVSIITAFLTGAFTGPVGWAAIGSVAAGVFGIGAVLGLILALGLLFTFIRLLLLLLNSYIQLLIALIIGPLQLLSEAIPGRSAFSGWILNIIANLIVFPTTVAVLMFAQFLTESDMSTPLFAPPLIGLPGEKAFPAFLGLGVLFLAPTLVASIKKAFHPKPALPLSAGTLAAPLTSTGQTAMGAFSQFYYMKGFIDMLKPKGPAH